jgi:hypothetical protein
MFPLACGPITSFLFAELKFPKTIHINKTMKKSRICTKLAIILAGVALISACTTENQNVKLPVPAKPPIAEPAPPPQLESPEKIAARSARATAQAELESGIALYNNGDYHGAIKRFGVISESLKPYKDLELRAIKFTAFSYCVTGRSSLCRLQFERAVKLDPSFNLEPGEKGHPLWGPVFDRVKKKEGN